MSGYPSGFALGAFLGLFSATVFGQPIAPATSLPALRVVAAEIRESRSDGGGSLSLKLTVTGDGMPVMAGIRYVNVTKAVDDQGRRLIPEVRRPILASGMGFEGPTAPPPILPANLVATAKFRGVPRNARSIAVIEGSMEIFVPEEANGSILRIADPMNESGLVRNVSGLVKHPILEKHGIDFRFSSNSVGYQRDPSNLVAGFEVQDAAGVPIAGPGLMGLEFESIRVTTMRFTNPLPKYARLVLYLALPESVRIVPFRIENIELP